MKTNTCHYVINTFGFRIAPLLTSANIHQHKIETHFVPETPSLCVRKPKVILSSYSGKKSESNPHLLKENFHELQLYYSDYEHIYTDGSKDENKEGCAAAKYDDCKQMCIPDGFSVFTAKAKAIDLALDFVENCTYTDKFVIFSDFLSVLQALNHTSSKNSHKYNSYY